MLNIFSKWKDKIAQNIDVHIRLFKLNFVERTSHVLSYFIFSILGLFFVFAVLVFMGMGLAEVFSELTQSRAAGYFLAMASYIVLFALVFLLRRPIIRAFSGIFVRILTDTEDDDDDDMKDENEYQS